MESMSDCRKRGREDHGRVGGAAALGEQPGRGDFFVDLTAAKSHQNTAQGNREEFQTIFELIEANTRAKRQLDSPDMIATGAAGSPVPTLKSRRTMSLDFDASRPPAAKSPVVGILHAEIAEITQAQSWNQHNRMARDGAAFPAEMLQVDEETTIAASAYSEHRENSSSSSSMASISTATPLASKAVVPPTRWPVVKPIARRRPPTAASNNAASPPLLASESVVKQERQPHSFRTSPFASPAQSRQASPAIPTTSSALETREDMAPLVLSSAITSANSVVSPCAQPDAAPLDDAIMSFSQEKMQELSFRDDSGEQDSPRARRRVSGGKKRRHHGSSRKVLELETSDSDTDMDAIELSGRKRMVKARYLRSRESSPRSESSMLTTATVMKAQALQDRIYFELFSVDENTIENPTNRLFFKLRKAQIIKQMKQQAKIDAAEQQEEDEDASFTT